MAGGQSWDVDPPAAVALQQMHSPSQAVRRGGSGGGNLGQEVSLDLTCLSLNSFVWRRGQLHYQLVGMNQYLFV